MQAVLLLTTLVCLLASAKAVDLDISILNFALNLEYLEANFYSCAAFGVPLTGTAMIGNGPVATGCSGQALLSPEVMALAVEIAQNEIDHVVFLRTALGAAAFDQPALNIGSAFTNLFNAAYGIMLYTPFMVYKSDLLFLLGAFSLEDVGVTAYKGAAPLITNKAYLGAAAGILAVEAYHGGAIRAMLLEMPNEYIFPYAITVSAATTAIAKLRAAVDGIGADDFGIVASGAVVVAPVDANAIAFGRLPKNVLPIVYLGGVAKGGFYPNGMSGVFTNSATAP